MAQPHTRQNYDDIFCALEWQKATKNTKTEMTMKEREEKRREKRNPRNFKHSSNVWHIAEDHHHRSAQPRAVFDLFCKKLLKMRHPFLGRIFKNAHPMARFFIKMKIWLYLGWWRKPKMCVFFLSGWTVELSKHLRKLHAINDCETWFN